MISNHSMMVNNNNNNNDPRTFTLNEQNIKTNVINVPIDRCDKKVEVRWLENEAEAYMKQWQRRYRQLEGVDDVAGRNKHPEHYDDWSQTARRILDIDVDCMRDYKTFSSDSSYTDNFDFFYNRKRETFLIDDTFDNDDSLDDEFIPFGAITIDPSNDFNFNELLAASIKSNNLIFKNGKLEMLQSKKTKEKTSKKGKQCSSNSSLSSNSSQSNSCTPKAKKTKNVNNAPHENGYCVANNLNKQRNRNSSTRRQMYTCEFPGCTYQSDRNFNFIRHKKTHGKQKVTEDACKKIACTAPLNNNNNSAIDSTNPIITNMTKNNSSTVEPSSFTPPSVTSTVAQNYLNIQATNNVHLIAQLTNFVPVVAHSTSPVTMSTTTTNNLVSASSFTLPNDELIDQTAVIKDLKSITLPENHSFAIGSSFM